MSFLAVFLESLGLGERGGGLFAVHSVQQIPLFLFFEERQLISRIERDFLFIYHIQQFRNQLRQADIAENLIFTLADLFSQKLTGLFPKIVPKLGTISFGGSPGLPFHGLQLHLVGEGSLAGEQAFPLEIAVHHDDGGGIIVQVPDNDRHGFFLGQLTGPVPPVPGYQLIAAFRVRAGNSRNQNTVLPHTVGSLHHGLVILDFKGMIFERVQLRQRNFLDLLQLGILASFFGGKQIIYRDQLYFFRAAFQVSSPPGSDFCIPRPPCLWGREHKCSFHRHWLPLP